METRLERNIRVKKLKRKKRAKRFCILILFSLLVFGVTVVNQTIVELNCLDNPTIISFDLESRELDLLGKTYVIDLSVLKKYY